MKILLNDLRFYGYHGLYDAEQRSGTYFIVNIELKYTEAKVINTIEETVNYAEVFELVKTEMGIATPLLETLAHRISGNILARFSLIEHITISIEKEAPPIPNFNGRSVGVVLELNR